MPGLAVPVPYQWQVGDTGNAALLNAQLFNGLTFLLNPPLFLAQQSSAQSFASGVLVAMTWPTPTIDTYGGWASGSPTRYTPTVPGYYSVTGTVACVANATGNRDAIISKNGTAIAQVSTLAATVADSTNVQVSTVVYCNGTTDYVEVYGVQRSGTPLTTVTGTTQVSVVWIHT
ncbi:hypothetical protein [Streptacidiphilus albus]|uniref:hypothetical protein n=1 Tax=Streptacidiphilus albus TaxID=105425 RepID=UPI0005A93116|nr:hypothetical protein [Streptacidiphilus albus]